MDHVSSTEVQKLDEEGKAVFVQHAKTFLDGLQTLLNAIRLAKADAPVKIDMHQYFGLLYCIVFSWHLTNIEEIWIAQLLMISFLHKEANTSAVFMLSIFGFLTQHLPTFLTPCIHTHTHTTETTA